MMELIETCNEILENVLVTSENLEEDSEIITSSLTSGILPGCSDGVS